jgi:hypothetical protein
MQRIRFNVLLFVFFLTATKGISQIIAPYANYSDTAYSNDTIYFFAPENDSVFIIADTANFNPDSIIWAKFVSGTGFQQMSFTGIKLFDTPTPNAIGYRLTIWENNVKAEEICWIASYTFNCAILEKVNGDTLGSGAYADCEQYGPIRLSINYDTVFYYNPATLATLFYLPKFKRIWTWDEETDETVRGEVVYRGTIGPYYKYYIEDAYSKDKMYKVTVTDSMGVEYIDSVFVKSIRPNADFDAEYILLEDKTYYPDKDTAYYFFYGQKSNYEKKSAPAYYLFISDSKNTHERRWDFGDLTTFNTTSDTVLKIYPQWGIYSVKLTAVHIVEWSGKQCIDTTTVSENIEVDKPVLEAPNAFSVNSPDYPAWRFYDVSITDFEISIFSRYGVRVHHFKGNIRDWDGWDGHINNSNNLASTGVYYYVVKEISSAININPDVENGDLWPSSTDTETDDKRPPNDEYRGFFHLFNNGE